MDRSELISPHGRCAIVELADDELAAALAALPEPERARAAQLASSRRRDFVAGRTALHMLVGDAAVEISDRGAPLVAGWTCSIAHKSTGDRSHAAALAAPAGAGFVGIDLERAVAPRVDIGPRILTPREPCAQGAELARMFALKEAVYKAIDPIVRRYVAFTEVEIAADGAVAIVDPVALPVVVDVWSTERAGFWLATACGRSSKRRP